ncbi:DUF1868 domain-containing protein [Martelella soudanensis]|uniref:DUF1868 domain-containing protein n=1 Tax=unclassified Martelella TaxID=2629616 RepID=UPI0015DD9C54|nr:MULTISPECIES: DUF1868 domain-containing protein [unclassified Martelella]
MNETSNNEERQPPADASLPAGVGSKFHADGTVRRFPGNTILCHLPTDSALRGPLAALWQTLDSSPLEPLYSLLPASSWHMTVFEGVCDEIRAPGRWPSDLSAAAGLADCHALFESKLAGFDPRIDPPLRITVAGWQPLNEGIALSLEPATPTENARLRDLRDRLSDLLKIRAPQHDSYEFHLSIGYLMRRPDAADKAQLMALLAEALERMPKTFELGVPEYCRFENMFAFEKLFFLGGKA